MNRRFHFAAAAALAVLLGSAGCSTTPVTPTPGNGALHITSEPEGARILIQGADTNLLTPHAFSAIGPRLEVRLLLDGYDEFVATVNVPVGGSADLHATLNRSYVRPTSPDSALWNLVAAYQRRDVPGYSAALAPGFVFRLEPVAAGELGRDSLGAAEETTFVHSLLEATADQAAASQAAFSMAISARGPDARPGHAGGQWIEGTARLDLVWTDGGGLHVSGKARLYFRQSVDAGAKWRLAEWQDLDPGGPSGPVTWSELHRLALAGALSGQPGTGALGHLSLLLNP